MRKSKWSSVYLTVILILLYLPMVIVILYSFNVSKSSSEITGFTLDWYAQLFQDTDIMTALKNSLVVAAISCLVSAVIGTLGAVGMAGAHFKSKGLLEGVAVAPMMIPEIILGMAFLAFFTMINLPFGMVTLVISHTTFCIPYIYILVKSRLVDIDKSIGEAALDLGASQMRMFLDITVPLVMPAIVSGTILAFAMSMDDVVISFFTTGPETNTLPIKIFSQLKVGVTPEINALSTIILGFTFLIIGLSNLITAKSKKNK